MNSLRESIRGIGEGEKKKGEERKKKRGSNEREIEKIVNTVNNEFEIP